eukprot:933511-Pleurochrysis_carterae.AAC.1
MLAVRGVLYSRGSVAERARPSRWRRPEVCAQQSLSLARPHGHTQRSFSPHPTDSLTHPSGFFSSPQQRSFLRRVLSTCACPWLQLVSGTPPSLFVAGVYFPFLRERSRARTLPVHTAGGPGTVPDSCFAKP